MKLNTSKMIFIYMILLSTLISLSVNNWFSMWMLMELTLFMFIPLISKNKVNDQSMKYFIIQSTSSFILMFSLIWNSINEMNMNSYLSMMGLLIKIGMPPFHSWKPMIMSKLAWKECMLLTTLIKVPPMIMLSKLVSMKMLIPPMLLSLAVGATGGINQNNLKKMMAYSSIFNLTWMTSSFLISKKTTMLFLILYSILNIKTMTIFKKYNLIFSNQMIYLPMKIKLLINLNLLSISGLPPLTGFFPKWVILNELVGKSLTLTSMMMMSSILSIFMYIQINTFNFSNSMVKKKNNKMILFKNYSMLNLLILPTMWMFWTN